MYTPFVLKGMSTSGPSDEKENIKVLNQSIELGSNFWDTSVRISNFIN
jgi:aryl-alcohol dehydrogenase-like predicted oxidoreductase